MYSKDCFLGRGKCCEDTNTTLTWQESKRAGCQRIDYFEELPGTSAVNPLKSNSAFAPNYGRDAVCYACVCVSSAQDWARGARPWAF